MTEIYKTFFETYEVSNYGNLRQRLVDGSYKIIEAKLMPQGYYYKTIKRVDYFIHRLVAKMFIGERPSSQHVVDHVNRNRLDNHISNLRYATYRENKQNSHNFKNYIQERTLKNGNKNYKVDIRRNGERHMKTFATREEADIWIDKEDYTDAVKQNKQGKGHVHIYQNIKGEEKYRAMTRIKQKLYTKVFTTEQDAKEWIASLMNQQTLPESQRRPPKSGGITERSIKSGVKYDAKITIQKVKHAKTFNSREEAEKWLTTFQNSFRKTVEGRCDTCNKRRVNWIGSLDWRCLCSSPLTV